MIPFIIFLYTWLGAGLFVAIEEIFVSQSFNDKNVKKIKEGFLKREGGNKEDPAVKMAFSLLDSKKKMFAIFTLFGYISLYLSIQSKIKHVLIKLNKLKK